MFTSHEKLVAAIRKRVATVCVSGSTTRGRSEGTLEAIRNYLVTIRLREFGNNRKFQFNDALTAHTEALQSVDAIGDFGLARKCLNLFLRDCFYNHYIHDYYHFSRAERFFEIPIDTIVAKELHRRLRHVAPAWVSIRKLTPQDHDKYQEAASILAKELRISRVHLDTFLWVKNR